MKKFVQQKWYAFVAIMLLVGCAKPYSTETTEPSATTDDGSVYGSNYNQAYGNGYDAYNSNNPYATLGGRGADNGDYYSDPKYGKNVQAGPQASERDRVIYFSYDSAQLDDRSVAVVREHAKYLVAHPSTGVVLEGHTDERGSREYNVGLGERRAYSVRRIFQQEGVNPAQMRVLSYGEERPAATCQSEDCYARNRRVVIVY